MGLSKKTFLYSVGIAAVMVIFIVGYFLVMLPSLYVDYVSRSDLKAAVNIQKEYIKERSYQNLHVKNPTAVLSVEIPDEGNFIYMRGKFFSVDVQVEDEELLQLFTEMKKQIKAKTDDFGENKEKRSEFFKIWERALQICSEKTILPEDYPFKFRFLAAENTGNYYSEYTRFHTIDNIFVYEGGIVDENYGYTTYIAMSWEEDEFIFTVLPAMTPQMEEITPIVMESLPMIISVIFLLILAASRFFSGKIVHPVISLANYAQNARFAGDFQMDAFEIKSGDEIETLGKTLHELFGRLYENCRELEQKNQALEAENERQEVFLRATSHQLKTPVAAGLLLLDGMIQEVGKYKNTKEYLPQVKSQFLSMQRIVEDVLALNFHMEHIQREEIMALQLTEEILKSYAVQIAYRELQIDLSGRGTFFTDRELLTKIVDNLIANAVSYTPKQERIEINAESALLTIRNYGVTIDETMLPNIFQPFVSSDTERKGKGLGLYLVSYYCRICGLCVEIKNMEHGVCTKLWERNREEKNAAYDSKS